MNMTSVGDGNLLSYKAHIKKGFLLGYPIMISMLGQVFTGVADSIMIGWTGAAPLAACSLANVFFVIPLIFGMGLSFAITPLVAEANSTSNHHKIASILKHGHLVNMVCGIALIFLVYICTQGIFYIGQPIAVARFAYAYLMIITPSILPVMIFQTFRQFAEGMHHTRMTMIIVIGSNLINVGLNYILIFGHFGFPALGIEGAAWATLLSKILMATGMYYYVYYKKTFIAYRDGFKFGQYQKTLTKKILHIGVPIGGQFVLEGGAFSFSSIMMGWLGTNALAAHQIALNLATISYMIISGFASSATIQTSHYLGLGDIRNVRSSAFAIMFVSILLMCLWATLFIFGRNFLPTLYVNELPVIAIASKLIVIAAFFQLSDGLQVVCNSALRGLQDVKTPFVLIFIAYWIIALPLGYVMTFTLGLGPIGIWLGLLIGLTITAVTLWFRFNLMSKQLKFGQ